MTDEPDDRDAWIKKLEQTVIEQSDEIKEMQDTYIKMPKDVMMLVGLQDDIVKRLGPFCRKIANATDFTPANQNKKREFMADVTGSLLSFAVDFA